MGTTTEDKARLQSDNAAAMERSGNWGEAKVAWRRAVNWWKRSPVDKGNIKYCNNRASFCDVMSLRDEYDDDE